MSLASIPSPMTRPKATFMTSTSSTPLSTPTSARNYGLGSSSSFRAAEHLKAAVEKGKMDLVDAYLESTIKPSRMKTPGTSFKSNSMKSQSSATSKAFEMKRAASALTPTISASTLKAEMKSTEIVGEPTNPTGDAKSKLDRTQVTDAAPAEIVKDVSVVDVSGKPSAETSPLPNLTSNTEDSQLNAPGDRESLPIRDPEQVIPPTAEPKSSPEDTVELPGLHLVVAKDDDAKSRSEGNSSNPPQVSTPAESTENDVSSRRKSFVLKGQIVNHIPYDILVRGCPPGVDPDKKEELLSNKEFEGLFKMSKAKFESLPKWRRDQLKKQLNLF